MGESQPSALRGAFVIEALGPSADQSARVVEVLEHVALEELVAHAVVQGLHEPAQPRLARRDERLERVVLAGPAPQGSGDEFRPVIGAQHLGRPMGQDSQVKRFDHVGGPKRRSTRKARC